jgi:hypothetical protein
MGMSAKCGSYVSIKFSALIIINISILIVDQIARNIVVQTDIETGTTV